MLYTIINPLRTKDEIFVHFGEDQRTKDEIFVLFDKAQRTNDEIFVFSGISDSAQRMAGRVFRQILSWFSGRAGRVFRPAIGPISRNTWRTFGTFGVLLPPGGTSPSFFGLFL